MSLKGKFSPDFSGRIRDRGFAYFRSNKVEILEHSESHVDARVKGSKIYLVRLKLGNVSLDVSCTCPYFEAGEECKHIWATMLAADSKNYLADASLRPRIHLRFEKDTSGNSRELDDDQNQVVSNPPYGLSAPDIAKTKNEPEPVWRRQLSLITNAVRANVITEAKDWPSGREILYLIDPQSTRTTGKLTVEIGYRERTVKGEWGKIKSQRIPITAISALKDPADQQILAILSGARDSYWPGYDFSYASISNRFALSTALQQLVLPMMCATGRCVLSLTDKTAEMRRVEWVDGPPWQFWLALRLDVATNEYTLRPVLRRAAEEIEVASAVLATEGIVIGPDLRAARLDSTGARLWTDALRKSGEFRIPAGESQDLIAHLLELPTTPRLDLPDELQFERVQIPPTYHLIVR